MKMICLLILLAALSASQVSAMTYYVDPDDGDDSWSGLIEYYIQFPEDGPLQTIKEALYRASTGDTIRLLTGNFIEATFDAGNKDYPEDPDKWDDSRRVQINVNKSITMDNFDSSVPVIIGFNDVDPDDTIDDLMLIDQPNVIIQNIYFDGENEEYQPDTLLNTHNVINITPDADSTQVRYCDFTNFGEEESVHQFFSIVGGGWVDQGNYVQYPKIKYNTFHDNPFEGEGAHEIYFCRTDSAEVMNNTIYNNGGGIPIKWRDGCWKMAVANNTVYGASTSFIGDYPNSGEIYSDSTYVYGNTFDDDSPSVIGNEYSKPFGPTAGHIIYFKDNNLYIPQTDSHYIHGITHKSNSNDLYYAWESGTKDSVYVLVNQHAPNPSDGYYGATGSNFHCQGDMCITDTTNMYVILCTQDSTGNQIVYKDDLDGVCDSSELLSYTSCPYITITAFANKPGSDKFLTALRDDSVTRIRIYESSTTAILNGTPKLDITISNADSITAMAYDGTDLVFATYKSGTSKIYKGAINSLSITTPVDSTTGYISAMCFSRGSLVTAVHDGSTQKLYYGTKTNPLTNSQTLTGKKVIALEGNSTYLYSLVHNTSGGTDRNKIYFTDNLLVYNDETYFFTHWYRDY